MEFLTFPDYRHLSRWAADQITGYLQNKPGLLLCPATGSTPLAAYRLLAEKAGEDPGIFAQLRIISLDEIVAPASAAPATCRAYLQSELLNPLRISDDRFLGFRSDAEPHGEAKRIREGLAELGGIDLCLLGLGVNGHLGFVEPAEQLIPHTHVVDLHPSSRQHQMFKNLPVPPERGLTIGIADILQSGRIILLVNGSHKKRAMQHLLEGLVTTRFPASLLWLHPNVVCAADEEAMP